MAPYLARAPEVLQDWILKELIAIEVEIQRSDGAETKIEAIRDTCGVSKERFDSAWEQVQESEVVNPGDEETKDIDMHVDFPTMSLRRGARAVSESMEMSIYRTQSEPAAPSNQAQKIPFLLVADDYELIDLLGEGGMGAVYRAFQHSLQRQVALKIIPRRFVSSPQALARFYNEAEATASMKHPGIVRVFEIAERGGVHYYTMELVEGGTLSDYVRSRSRPRPKRIEPNRAAEIMAKVSDAAHYAHTRPKPVIHRDIKPANILMDDSGNPLLTDFGLAKVMDNEEESLTMTGTALGTAAYMAPEQARGSKRDLSARTDVYALGATLYALIAGRQPFEGATSNQIMRQVIESTPTPLTKLVPSVARELEIICEKCLAKRPEHRYESAGALADDLRRFLSGQSISTRPLNVLQRSWRWSHRNPLAASLLGSILVGFVVSTVLGVQAMRSAKDATEKLGLLQNSLNQTVEMANAPELVGEPSIQDLRMQLLAIARDNFEQLATQRKDDAGIGVDFAEAQVSLGKVAASLLDQPAATTAFETAQQTLKSLGVYDSDDTANLELLAKAHQELSRIAQTNFNQRDQTNEQLTANLEVWIENANQAFAVRKRAAELEPDSSSLQRLAANAQENYAVAISRRGFLNSQRDDLSRAMELINEVQEIRRELVSRADATMAVQLDLARGFVNLSHLHQGMVALHDRNEEWLEAQNQLQQAETVAGEGIETLLSIGNSISENTTALKALAECYILYARRLYDNGKYDEAIQQFRKATREWQSIAEESPHLFQYRHDWAECRFLLFYHLYLHPDGAKTVAFAELDSYCHILLDALSHQYKNVDASDAILQKLEALQDMFLGDQIPGDDLRWKLLAQAASNVQARYQTLIKNSLHGRHDWLESEVTRLDELLAGMPDGQPARKD